MVWFSSLQTLGKCIHDGKKDYLDIFKIHFRKYLVLGKSYIFIFLHYKQPNILDGKRGMMFWTRSTETEVSKWRK